MYKLQQGQTLYITRKVYNENLDCKEYKIFEAAILKTSRKYITALVISENQEVQFVLNSDRHEFGLPEKRYTGDRVLHDSKEDAKKHIAKQLLLNKLNSCHFDDHDLTLGQLINIDEIIDGIDL